MEIDWEASVAGLLALSREGQEHTFGALDPAIKKWYIPQELFNDYGWKQWEYSNYAKEEFRRYVNIHREGDSFYDFYGNLIGRGWLIYDWSQNQPEQLGSSIFKTHDLILGSTVLLSVAILADSITIRLLLETYCALH